MVFFWFYSYLSHKRTSYLKLAHQITWGSPTFKQKMAGNRCRTSGKYLPKQVQLLLHRNFMQCILWHNWRNKWMDFFPVGDHYVLIIWRRFTCPAFCINFSYSSINYLTSFWSEFRGPLGLKGTVLIELESFGTWLSLNQVLGTWYLPNGCPVWI